MAPSGAAGCRSRVPRSPRSRPNCTCRPRSANCSRAAAIRDLDDARRYLRPRLDQLLPPSRLPGMGDAVARITRALRAGEMILLHGDYDVDGMASTAIMLRALRALGARVDAVHPAPHRGWLRSLDGRRARRRGRRREARDQLRLRHERARSGPRAARRGDRSHHRRPPPAERRGAALRGAGESEARRRRLSRPRPGRGGARVQARARDHGGRGRRRERSVQDDRPRGARDDRRRRAAAR